MKFGVRDGVLRQPWEQTFGEAAWLGFDGVELDVGADYESSLLWSETGRLRLRQMQAGTGRDLAAFCLGGLWSISPADNDPATRDRAVQFIQEATRFTRAVGCSVILVPITPAAEAAPEEQRARWIESLRECAPVAEQEQVCLAIENVGRGSAQSARDLLTIVDGVSSPAVQVYYDPGNALLLGQDPVAELRMLGSRIRQLHAKDPGGKVLGTGRVPFPEVIAAVKEIGYNGYIVLETDPTEDPVRAATDNLHFLQEAFA